MNLDFSQPPSLGLYQSVRAGFILNNTTLGKWCNKNNIALSHTKHTLMGAVNGKKSIALRKKVIADVQALAKGA